ncbi:hypothetical protein ACFWPU_25780, partial [Streptomyces sp. NPDC058471]|uniref:hypothetical protein n=1 Tax=Streptomyces sp. NPDC058471 TaxID=3346516 RepID=UPI00365E38D4
ADRCRSNARLVTEADSPLAFAPATTPVAGYSAFPRLVSEQGDFLSWIRATGRTGLRLNPTVVHGGTASAWQSLYPNQHLRINLSERPDHFAWGLDQIRNRSRAHSASPGSHPRRPHACPSQGPRDSPETEDP